MKPIGLYCILLFFAKSTVAQDVHFSQFYNFPLSQNPGNTGTFKEEIRGVNIFRMQWIPISAEPFKSFGISLDAPIFKSKMKSDDYFSTGICFLNEKAGVNNFANRKVSGLFSFNKSLNKEKSNRIVIGFGTGFVNRKSSFQFASWDNQFVNGAFDPSYPTGEVFQSNFTLNYFDLDFGIIWQFTFKNIENVKIGYSLSHLNKANIGVNNNERLYLKYLLHSNGSIKISQEHLFYIEPAFEIILQGSSFTANAGLNVKKEIQQKSLYTNSNKNISIALGAYYRYLDAFVSRISLDFDTFSLGFAYDISTSGISKANHGRGGFELFLSYKGLLKPSKTIKLKVN